VGPVPNYWILISPVLTVFCTVVLLLHMPTVSANAAMLRGTDMPNGAGGRIGGDFDHPGVGLILLPGIAVLNV